MVSTDVGNATSTRIPLTSHMATSDVKGVDN